jgi:hypothetical protein
MMMMMMIVITTLTEKNGSGSNYLYLNSGGFQFESWPRHSYLDCGWLCFILVSPG